MHRRQWLISAAGLAGACSRTRERAADVLVYGATPAGVLAATAAQRLGASVLLIDAGEHIGGMVTGGLCRTDVGARETVGGLAREILDDIAARTPAERQTPKRPWDLNPHVAMAAFDEWLQREAISPLLRLPLRSAEKERGRITSVRLADDSVAHAEVFVDASYEGDLMAAAGVGYTVGRESRDAFGEEHAGWYQHPRIIYSDSDYAEPCPCLGGSGAHYLHLTQFGADIPAQGANGGLLWGVHANAPGTPGSADHKVQAYCFRLCVTRDESLRVPWPEPANYRPEWYELLARYIAAHPGMSFYALHHLGQLPNAKFDLNSAGPFSIDFVGGSWDYPDADWDLRREIIRQHEDYQKGLLWFLAHDERSTPKIRAEAAQWGLCRDEFPANGHWSPQIYVREGRRLLGEYVMRERDITTDIRKDDAVGMGSFIADSHPVQRFTNDRGMVEEEGHLAVRTQPYEIPYRSLTPKASACENLLVPVCLSASHVAVCSIRMEPVYMMLGHAAGVAAATAAKDGRPVQELDALALRQTLRSQGQRI